MKKEKNQRLTPKEKVKTVIQKNSSPDDVCYELIQLMATDESFTKILEEEEHILNHLFNLVVQYERVPRHKSFYWKKIEVLIKQINQL
jgi:hypothetical protein